MCIRVICVYLFDHVNVIVDMRMCACIKRVFGASVRKCYIIGTRMCVNVTRDRYVFIHAGGSLMWERVYSYLHMRTTVCEYILTCTW